MSRQWKIGVAAGSLLLGAVALSLFLFARSGDKTATGNPQPVGKSAPESSEEGVSGNMLTNSIGMKFVLVPAGKFVMGSPESEAAKGEKDPQYAVYRQPHEGPQHDVVISKPFYLGVREVTQQEFEKGLGFTPASDNKFLDYPKALISWTLANAFCKDLSELPVEKKAGRKYRLPTEAEWEYACRAGSDKPYTFGDDPKLLKEHAWFGVPDGGKSHPVGQLKPNAFDLYDMHGNVYEWCSDWFDAYKPASAEDPKGPSAPIAFGSHYPRCVLRGGSWRDDPKNCRSACRNADGPNSFNAVYGFRLVCEVAEKK